MIIKIKRNLNDKSGDTYDLLDENENVYASVHVDLFHVKSAEENGNVHNAISENKEIDLEIKVSEVIN